MAKKRKFLIEEHFPVSPLREKSPGTWRFDCNYADCGTNLLLSQKKYDDIKPKMISKRFLKLKNGDVKVLEKWAYSMSCHCGASIEINPEEFRDVLGEDRHHQIEIDGVIYSGLIDGKPIPMQEIVNATDCGYFLDEYAFLDGEDIPPWIRGLYCKKTV